METPRTTRPSEATRILPDQAAARSALAQERIAGPSARRWVALRRVPSTAAVGATTAKRRRLVRGRRSARVSESAVGGSGRKSADANSEHAWNDMFLYPICQEKNSVSVIFSCKAIVPSSGLSPLYQLKANFPPVRHVADLRGEFAAITQRLDRIPGKQIVNSVGAPADKRDLRHEPHIDR